MHERTSSPSLAPHGLSALGPALRERRRAMGLTQEALAELVPCSTRFVHMAEAGKLTLQLDRLVALLQVLGLQLQLRIGPGGLALALPDTDQP